MRPVLAIHQSPFGEEVEGLSSFCGASYRVERVRPAAALPRSTVAAPASVSADRVAERCTSSWELTGENERRRNEPSQLSTGGGPV